MEIIKIVGIALAAAALSVILRQYKTEYSMMLGLSFSVFAILFCVYAATRIIPIVNGFAESANVNGTYLSILFKAVGITYLAQFGADLCRDVGESAIASKVELAGRAIILLLAMPLYVAVFEIIGNLL